MKVTDLSRLVTDLIFLKMKQLAILNEVQIQYFKVPKLKATSTYAFALIFCSKVWLNLELPQKCLCNSWLYWYLMISELDCGILPKKTSRK